MRNDILLHENRQLRERLQVAESRQRKVGRLLDRFREHLLTMGMTVPIADIAELIGQLDAIRAWVGGEVQS